MPQLGRLYKYALRDNGDVTVGVSLNVYREGATVNGTQSGTSPFTVTVLHPGKIKVSDTVFIGTSTSTPYTVSTTPTATTIILTGFGGTLNLANGDRIVPSNSRPTIYSDDQGSGSTTNPLTSASDGLWSCFLEFGAYDMLQSGGGLSTKLHPGLVIGSEAPGQVRFADDFAALSVTGGIQEAIDDLPSSGGKVFCSGSRTYSLTSSTASLASIWLHSGIELVVPAGCIIQRATGASTSATGVICAGPKGSNGTEFGVGTEGSNIAITGGGIIDGNESNFTSNVGHGIRIKYTNGILIDGVTIQNTEQDGIYLESPLNFRIANVHLDTVGQATSVTQRNGISLYNSAATTGWGQKGTVSNVSISTVGAAGASAVGEAISTIDMADLTFTNITIDGCDYAFELNAHNAGAEWNRDIAISNAVVKNARFTFVGLFSTVAATWSDITLANSSFTGHATLHNGGAFWVAVGATAIFDGISISNCIFRNVNSSDTANRSFVQTSSTTAAGSSGLTVSNCQFYGKSGSTVTTGAGFSLNGGLSDILLSNVLVKNIPGIGFNFGGIAGVTSTAREITLSNCIADTCTGDGFKVSAGVVTTTQDNFTFTGCIAKDCGISGNNSRGFYLVTTVGAGATVKNIKLNGCRAYKTSGTFMLYGLNVTAFAASTVDSIFVDDCDFLNVQTAELVTSGTITKLNFSGSYHGTQSLTAVGNALVVPSKIKHCTLYVDSDGNYTLTSTPTIADGLFDGQRLTIMNVDATPNTFGLQDEGGLAGSNLLLDTVLVGGNTFTLNQGDNITFAWSSALSAWVSIGMQNGIA